MIVRPEGQLLKHGVNPLSSITSGFVGNTDFGTNSAAQVAKHVAHDRITSCA